MQDTTDRPSARRLGTAGEDHAARWLESNGYTVIDRNWRCARGELDIVARTGQTLVFVEVKTRAGSVGGHPFEAVTAVKLARIRRLVPTWFAEHPGVRADAIRVDVLAVHRVAHRFVVEHLADVR